MKRVTLTGENVKCWLTCTNCHCKQGHQHCEVHRCRHVERGKGLRSYRQHSNTLTHTHADYILDSRMCWMPEEECSKRWVGTYQILRGWLVNVWTRLCVCLQLHRSCCSQAYFKTDFSTLKWCLCQFPHFLLLSYHESFYFGGSKYSYSN